MGPLPTIAGMGHPHRSARLRGLAARAVPARLWELPTGLKDVGLAAGITVASFVPVLADKGTALGWLTPQRPFDALAVVLVVLQAAPLAIRGRATGLCLAVVSGAFLVYQSLGYRPTFASLALYVVLYSAGMAQTRFRSGTAVLWTAAYVAASAWMVHAGSPFPPRDFALFFVLPAGCWLLGAWSRARLREQARHHRDRLRAELDEERERIARELHDVVTHHVTAMVMQADAAQYVSAGERAKVDAGLAAIGSTGRHALADLRELLGLLSPGHDARPVREPPVGRLTDLVDRARAAGQPVEFVEDLSPIGDLTMLAVYRVVQEGLTNALKHAPGRRTVVRLSRPTADGLLAEVTTDGDDDGPVTPWGRGLSGLRRRVVLAGGEFTAYPVDGGGFTLSARFPDRR